MRRRRKGRKTEETRRKPLIFRSFLSPSPSPWPPLYSGRGADAERWNRTLSEVAAATIAAMVLSKRARRQLQRTFPLTLLPFLLPHSPSRCQVRHTPPLSAALPRSALARFLGAPAAMAPTHGAMRHGSHPAEALAAVASAAAEGGSAFAGLWQLLAMAAAMFAGALAAGYLPFFISLSQQRCAVGGGGGGGEQRW